MNLTGTNNRTPPTIDRMVNNLISFVRPAFPNRQLVELIQENAKNWDHTMRVTLLRDIYKEEIRQHLLLLENNIPDP